MRGGVPSGRLRRPDRVGTDEELATVSAYSSASRQPGNDRTPASRQGLPSVVPCRTAWKIGENFKYRGNLGPVSTQTPLLEAQRHKAQSRWNFENFFEVSPPYDTALTPSTWKASFSETLDFRIQWIAAILDYLPMIPR